MSKSLRGRFRFSVVAVPLTPALSPRRGRDNVRRRLGSRIVRRLFDDEILAEAVHADGVFFGEAGAGEADGLAGEGDGAGGGKWLRKRRRRSALPPHKIFRSPDFHCHDTETVIYVAGDGGGEPEAFGGGFAIESVGVTARPSPW